MYETKQEMNRSQVASICLYQVIIIVIVHEGYHQND